MIASIALREARTALRSGVVIAAGIAVLAVVAAAALAGAGRVASFERERAAAEASDRAVWDSQGDRNPHSAAHFSRYAFRPTSPLASFDPGVLDYSGLAVWMEAHYRNPAVFRRAEETARASGRAALSPAWTLQFPATLILALLLFASVAGDRESGALRQIAAAGVRWPAFVAGKAAGALAIVAAIVLPALALAMVAVPHTTAGVLPDAAARSLGLVAAYAVFFAIVAFSTIGFSAMFRSKRSALALIAGLWALSFVAAPRIAAEAARAGAPEPDAAAMTAALRAASAEYWEDDAFIEADRKELLARYGVSDVTDLPVNFDAYTLQRSEEYANPKFAEIYRSQADAHRRQEGIIRAVSLASPVIALAELSRGLAATDRLHQLAFAEAAEAHRQRIVEQLNADMLNNAGAAGYEYKANDALWRAVEDFRFTPPPVSSFAAAYVPAAATLLLQLALSVLFAAFAVARALLRAGQ